LKEDTVTMHQWVIAVALGVLLAHAAVSGQPRQPRPAELGPEASPVIVNTIPIVGPPEAVFDLVTTARFWPQWHPATQAVGGVTERPYQLGSHIHERGRIGNRDFQVTWTVVEHVRPSRVVLRTERPPAQITYTFQARDGTTVFTRELQYQVDNPAAVSATPNALDRLMREQSAQAVHQLQGLVEQILRAEATAPP
jgi:uncharacterized protein YndB with AHSA1/START domain